MGGFCPVGFCPGGFCPREDFVQGDFVLEPKNSICESSRNCYPLLALRYLNI